MKIIINLYIYLSRFLYMFFKVLPVRNKVVMISRQADFVNLDFKLLGKELEEKYKVVYLCKMLKSGIKAKLRDKISYGFHTLRQMYHLSTSRVCILDSYCPTVSILHHKKKLTVIQMWHSIGTMKKFGYSILDTEEGSRRMLAKLMHMHENYDLIFAASSAYSSHLAAGFNCEKEKIVIKTLPRVDLLLSKKYEQEIREKILKEYPSLKQKKNILYCPTFRKNEKNFRKAVQKLIDNIDYSKYNLIIKLHPLSKTKVTDKRVLFDTKFSTFEMLFIADLVVSDYSCIIYEAGLKNIPIYFYSFDIDDYQTKRGLMIDYKELPGYKEKKASELVKTFEKKYDYKYLRNFINKYVTNKKNCTRKIAKVVSNYIHKNLFYFLLLILRILVI